MARDAEGYNTALVRVATTGTIFKAPVGTDMPEAGKPVSSDWVPFGTFTDDGVEHEFSEETEEVNSMQRGVVRVITTQRTLTLSCPSLESSPAVLGEFYGSIPEIDAANQSVEVRIKPHVARPKSAFLFEWRDGDAVWRMLIPVGQVSEVDSPTFSNSEAVSWAMTLQALGGGEDLAIWQINDAAFMADLPSEDQPPSEFELTA